MTTQSESCHLLDLPVQRHVQLEICRTMHICRPEVSDKGAWPWASHRQTLLSFFCHCYTVVSHAPVEWLVCRGRLQTGGGVDSRVTAIATPGYVNVAPRAISEAMLNPPRLPWAARRPARHATVSRYYAGPRALRRGKAGRGRGSKQGVAGVRRAGRGGVLLVHTCGLEVFGVASAPSAPSRPPGICYPKTCGRALVYYV
jgi:hypothetical protein